MSTETSTEFARILAEIADPFAVTDGIRHGFSVYHLATLADCYSPDGDDSPGAGFLAGIARDLAERVTYGADTADEYRANLAEITDGDGAHEIADGAVPIYTHQRWATFTDLGAYNEDVTELGDGDASDLTGLAGVALYIIAERLVRALAEELSAALDADDDDSTARELHLNGVHTDCPAECLTMWDENGDDRE